MTQEDKDLLLKDLCARLPYGVKVQVADYKTPIELSHINTKNGNGRKPYCFVFAFGPEKVKPYLRPMSSMSEEEKKEYNSFFQEYAPDDRWPYLTKNFVEEDIVSELIDWLNKKMFDYRGLIPRRLAISTEVFNPYKD